MSNQIVSFLFNSTLLSIISLFAFKYALDKLDPNRKKKQETRSKVEKLFKKLGINIDDLDEYELSIATYLVDPSSLDVCWNDIAGLENVIDELKNSVVFPLTNPKLYYSSNLHKPAKGILLCGPPGCGKTMIAKATAKESGARFINLEVSGLSSKWYGESQKLTAALFSLASKLQPCIIFIDEIDSFLRSRSSTDHETTALMKAQFLMQIDGLTSKKNCQVILMGATNRPADLDNAILRRMPIIFEISLPTKKKREDIFRSILANETLDKEIDFVELSTLTDNFSGSDIYELCRSAAMERIREIQKTNKEVSSLRPIKMEDFRNSLKKYAQSKSFGYTRDLCITYD